MGVTLVPFPQLMIYKPLGCLFSKSFFGFMVLTQGQVISGENGLIARVPERKGGTCISVRLCIGVLLSIGVHLCVAVHLCTDAYLCIDVHLCVGVYCV